MPLTTFSSSIRARIPHTKRTLVETLPCPTNMQRWVADLNSRGPRSGKSNRITPRSILYKAWCVFVTSLSNKLNCASLTTTSWISRDSPSQPHKNRPITSTSLFHRRHKKDKKDKKKLADKAAATVAAAKGREEEDERGDALSKE